MRESRIEKTVCRYAKSLGVLSYKFTSPARRSVPDQIFFFRGHCWLIEFKAPGKKPRSGQVREIDRLRDQLIPVFVVDNIEVGKQIIAAEWQHASKD